MKFKGGGEEHFVKGKIVGTFDSWHLSFGKFKGKGGSEVNDGYLQWMLREMTLQDDEIELIEAILRGERPKGVSAPKKGKKTPLWQSKVTSEQAADIAAQERETRPPQPSKLNSVDEARIQDLEKSLKAMSSKVFELMEQIHGLEMVAGIVEVSEEHKKIEKALDEFEKNLPNHNEDELDYEEEEMNSYEHAN